MFFATFNLIWRDNNVANLILKSSLLLVITKLDPHVLMSISKYNQTKLNSPPNFGGIARVVQHLMMSHKFIFVPVHLPNLTSARQAGWGLLPLCI